MNRLVWITDPHFDFLDPWKTKEFIGEMARAGKDATTVITGDIATAKTLAGILRLIHESVPRVFFVLGNHDAYGGSIAGAREIAAGFSGYLTARTGPVALTSTTCLIGHDGWADGRLGDYHASPVMLNDYVHIRELTGLSREGRLRRLNELGDGAAFAIRGPLLRALADYSHVIMATHVPPIRPGCWQGDRAKFDDWAPHFFSQVMEQVLAEIMRAHPDRRLTILGGHIHVSRIYRLMDNITLYTGNAVYGEPGIQCVFSVDDLVAIPPSAADWR